MLFVDYAGETIALLLAQPNYARPVTVELSLPFTDVAKAISARETRRAYQTSARYLFSYSAWFSAARQSTDFRLWINRLKGETVAVPLWVDGVKTLSLAAAGATSLNITGSQLPVRSGSEWIIISADLATYEIVTVSAVTSSTVTTSATTLTWAAGTMLYPLMFGKFADRPKAESATPEKTSVDFSIQENSDYARRLNPASGVLPTVGPGVPAFSTAKIFNVIPNYVRPMDETEIDILYRAIGFLRREQQYEYQQPARRGLEWEIVGSNRDAIAKVERFLVDRRGPVRNFFVPSVRNDLKLTQDLPISGHLNRITIEGSRFSDPDYAEHPGHPYLALIEDGFVYPYKLTDVSGSNLTTAINIAEGHTKARTLIAHLLLARFSEAKISWTYVTPSRARTTLRFVEVPDEYVTPSVEIPPRAFIYKFTEVKPVPEVWWFTSYENSLTFTDGDGAHVCAPAPFSHGSIKSGNKLDREEVDLTSWGGNFPTNPLGKYFPYILEGELLLEIWEVSADDPDDEDERELLISGKVTKPDFTGKDWKATVRRFGSAMERNVGRFNFQKVCNVSLYSAKCGVNKEDFKTTVRITALNGKLIDVATGAVVDEDYWAPGFLESRDTSKWEARSILHSEAIDGGYRLTIDRSLRLGVVDDDLYLYPGCNFSIGMCIDRFNNQANFRGHPYIPIKNPSANMGEVAHTSGGKKG